MDLENTEGEHQAEATGQMLLFGRFQPVRLLGSGTTGQVFLSKDTLLPASPLLAVKILHSALYLDEDAVRRLRREILLTRNLSHPNIVKVFDFGSDQGASGSQPSYYVVMEYIDGQSLKLLLANGPVPFATVETLFFELLAGLQHAHELGIVHRDIKPENLLRTSQGTLKITDFGSARSLLSGQTIADTGAYHGTPAYMAPEIFQNMPASAQSDIYSAALVIHELLTGRRVFEENNLYTLCKRQLNESPPLLEAKHAPAWFSDLLQRCLAKDPRDRWCSAAALAAELVRRRDAPKTPLQRWLRSIRKNPFVSGFARLFTVLLVVTLFLQLLVRLESSSFLASVSLLFTIESKLESTLPPLRALINYDEHQNGLYLIRAAEAGNIELVRQFLEKGIRVDSLGAVEKTPLSMAVHRNNIEMIRILVDEHIKLASRGIRTRVSETLWSESLDVKVSTFKELIRLPQYDANRRLPNGLTLLQSAVTDNKPDYVTAILDSGADPLLQTSKNAQPLEVAVHLGHEEAMNAFLNNPHVSLPSWPKQAEAILGFAYKFNPQCIPVLIEKGAGSAEVIHETLIPKLMLLNDLSILRKVLKSPRVSVAYQLHNSLSLLNFAIALRNPGSVKELISAGASLRTDQNFGVSPLDLAVASGLTEVAEIIRQAASEHPK